VRITKMTVIVGPTMVDNVPHLGQTVFVGPRTIFQTHYAVYAAHRQARSLSFIATDRSPDYE
jgi:hypothetical protein